MGRVFKYELPFPPSVNHYWSHNRFGSTYVNAKGKQFRKDVIALLTKVANTGRELRVTIGYLRPDERIRDLDNYQKALYDALKYGRVYKDDSQIVDKREYWLGIDPMRIGKSVVTIEELT